jgi:hypothetical protein
MSDSPAFYCEPVPELSQGDVVEIAPHAYLDPPLRHLALGSDGHEELKECRVASLQPQAAVLATCSPCKALIVNYDCEISKRGTLRLLVCPIRPLSEFPPTDRGNLKANRTAHLFFLPRYREKLEDSVAVLNQLTTVHKVLLSDIDRLATLGKTGRLAFYGQFVRWLTRWELRLLTCPNCKAEFDPTLALPVRLPSDP